MNSHQYPIHHLGIAVTDLASSITDYEKLGWKVVLREMLPERELELIFLKGPNTLIELLSPTGPNSTVSKFLATRGPGLHHICFEVPDIVAALRDVKAEGKVLIDETPRTGAAHSKIAFIQPSSFGGTLVELLEVSKSTPFR